MAEPPLPTIGGRRSWRPAAIVAGALAAVLLLAVLADGRLLVADPDPSVVTEEDIRLARSLFGGAVPPESLAEACIDEGTIDPACLGDGLPGDAGGDVSADVIPRACRDDGSVSVACLERELDIDIPRECTAEDGSLDVGCAAAAGRFLTLTDQCIDDDRLRQECLEGRVYGVPDPGPDEVGDDGFLPRPDERASGGGDVRSEGLDGDAEPRDQPDEPEEDEGRGTSWMAAILRWIALLLLVGLALAGVVLLVRYLTGWRPRPLVPAVPDADEEDAHDRAVMAASIDAGARQLDLSGDPRQAIIAAYALLLDGLAACAQARRLSETPLEHLERVLAALDVRPEPLRELTTLFGEARFSAHVMTDAHRDRARAALAAAAVDLDRVRAAVG